MPHFAVELYLPRIMKLSTQLDYQSAKLLDEILCKLSNSEPFANLCRRYSFNCSLVLMPGPSLKLLNLKKRFLLEYADCVVIADSTVEYLLREEYEFTRKLRSKSVFLVTDLDADLGYLVEFAYLAKPVIIVHAHGDNLEKIREIIPVLARYSSTVTGTCQVLFYGKYVMPCRGFTDGDRAVYISSLISRKVLVLGFDPSDSISLASKPLTSIKREKLKIAEKEVQHVKLDQVLVEVLR